MKRVLGFAVVVAWALTGPSRAAAAPPAVIAVVKLSRVVQRGVPCGYFFPVGEAEYEVIRVERGQLDQARLAVEIACPADSWAYPVNGLTRLELSRTRPSGWPKLVARSTLPTHLYQLEARSLVPELLDMPEDALDATFPRTGTDGAWQVHGQLAVLLERGRVARVRLTLPPHWPTGDHPDLGRLGYPDAGRPDFRDRGERRWSGRGDHRLARGIAASRRGNILELWRVE